LFAQMLDFGVIFPQWAACRCVFQIKY